MLETLHHRLTEPPRAATPLRVRSADDLRRALREARGRPVALDTSGLNRVLHADEDGGRIEVQGAATWRDLAARLGARGAPLLPWARDTLPDTVGDAIDRDVPAPDGRPLAAYVESVALATVDGALRRVDRSRDARLFHHVVGGQGVFGMLYSVTLRADALSRAAAQAQAPCVLALDAAGWEDAGSAAIDVLVPPQHAEEFIRAARALATGQRVALHRVVVRRLQPHAEAVLGWGDRRWARVALHLADPPGRSGRAQAAAFQRSLLEAAIAQGGTFPASAAAVASRAQLEACLPALRGFIAEKRRYDPGGHLQNDWYRRVTESLR